MITSDKFEFDVLRVDFVQHEADGALSVSVTAFDAVKERF